MNTITGIYKIENLITKRVYIGQSRNILKRFSQYKALSCTQQKKIYGSLLKYGVENHSFEIIQECGADKLNELEKINILKYDSIKKGLNISMANWYQPKAKWAKGYAEITYSLMWYFKEHPQYQFTKCRKCFNLNRGRQVKSVLNGGSIGYWIAGSFYPKSKINDHLVRVVGNKVNV